MATRSETGSPATMLASPTRPRLGVRTSELLWRSVATLIIAAGAVAVVFPLLWMLSTSLKAAGQVLLQPPQWVPATPQWQNYPQALDSMHWTVVYRNSAIVSLSAVLGEILSASLVAFAFARLRTPGRSVLFMLVLATLMLPQQVLLIPQFILFKHLGWIDTLLPLIVPTFFAGPFNVFLLRQFFLSIPSEMDDAARMDGCGYFGLYWRILLPLSRPALGVVAIFTFLGNWNDFLKPLIYLNTQGHYTVALALQNFTADYGMTPWNLLMAASLMALLPCIGLFFLAQRYFIQGVVITGVKG
ncbi:MAG TPA: carbohydrate ABC transporter permease [Chloroflexota bacterium]|jgi:ABC-type glycerol-3-phosphate transport system permease component